MVEARWNGVTIARSDDTVVVDGNHYFPRSDVDASMSRPNASTTTCPWKGKASYYSLRVGDADNRNAAWFYPDPKSAAENIRDRIAFWKGVEVS